MGQTFSANFHLQRCEPGVAQGALVSEPAFGIRSRKPVSAELEGDGEFSTPGIAFEDFSRMSTMQRKTSGERRLPTPSWAVNQSELRALLVRFFERRVGIVAPGNGSDIQRLNAAQRKLLSRIPGMTEVLDRLCREYTEVKDADPARATVLQIEIQNLDTSIRMARMGPGGVARVVHLYYGCAYDSCAVASEIGITPMHVRQTLFRLHRAAKPVPPKRCVCGNELAPRKQKCDACKSKPRRCACGAELEPEKRKCDACRKPLKSCVEKRRKAGVCIDCGKRNAHGGTLRCEPCSERRAINRKNWLARQQRRQERPDHARDREPAE